MKSSASSFALFRMSLLAGMVALGAVMSAETFAADACETIFYPVNNELPVWMQVQARAADIRAQFVASRQGFQNIKTWVLAQDGLAMAALIKTAPNGREFARAVATAVSELDIGLTGQAHVAMMENLFRASRSFELSDADRAMLRQTFDGLMLKTVQFPSYRERMWTYLQSYWGAPGPIGSRLVEKIAEMKIENVPGHKKPQGRRIFLSDDGVVLAELVNSATNGRDFARAFVIALTEPMPARDRQMLEFTETLIPLAYERAKTLELSEADRVMIRTALLDWLRDGQFPGFKREFMHYTRAYWGPTGPTVARVRSEIAAIKSEWPHPLRPEDGKRLAAAVNTASKPQEFAIALATALNEVELRYPVGNMHGEALLDGAYRHAQTLDLSKADIKLFTRVMESLLEEGVFPSIGSALKDHLIKFSTIPTID